MKKIAVFVLVLLAVITSYVVWLNRDITHLQNFCESISAGTAIEQLPTLAKEHGISVRYVKRTGIYDEKAGNWFLPVPAPATMGDTACVIRHDKSVVLSVEFNDR